ncbi:HNH endonuclease [Stenotrophomonas maltophilia]|uniref:HNH endonuclease n=2 Tax=Stenotrophomonas TaxID=40323 RepID=A0AAI9FWN3_STEMA|nr:HNH endonuclease [Stenotrophomonas sp. CFS3442]EKT4094467.1 HNH endonuclease [Stenotrophomonas maltophilia]UUS13407.1 HNH endonuclease [Stenotrophomonas sp. CD2]MBH1617151.1 HNH endonuclease [Stenotrophomonas maltophilia]MCV0323483.1 HNH endonuclease [Stenotrophomonas sp. CFS3442]HEL4101344.1 HNH endonuclease [Stenotrophomonas maltophilia]
MIALSKVDKPAILEEKAAAWTEELRAILADGKEPTKYLLSRYSHPDIKASLLLETSGKCAYCESVFRHVTYGDIEHILPKHARPELRFEWANLTIACDVCNTGKGEVEVFDPYVEDPVRAFLIMGPLIWAMPGNDAALIAEARLDLNRSALVQRRIEWLEYVRSLIASARDKPRDVRDAIIEKVRRECDVSRPYSAFAKQLLDLPL